ncbi:MAG: ABC transporter ATP-binding protein/permease [Oscillospiraceae bacterium]|nr:ABC transporter ATP-binding protein/permease [Oscillospiraceae bacterium]
MKKYFLKHKALLAIVVLANLVFAAVAAYAAFLLRDALNVALEADLSGFRGVIIISAIYLPLFAVTRYLVEVLSAKLAGKIIRDVRTDVFTGIMSQSMTNFGAVNSADYISALSNDIELFQKNYIDQIFAILFNLMVPFFAIGIMFYLSPIVAGFVLLSLLFLVVIPSLFGKGLQKRQEKLSGRLSLFTIKNKDIFSGFEIIKSYQMFKQANQDFNEQNKGVFKAQVSFDYFRGISVSISMFLAMLMQIGTILVSGYLIIQGNLTGGALLGLIQASGLVSSPLQMLSEAAPMIQGSKSVRERLLALAEVEANQYGTENASLNETIEVKNLEFTYPEQEQPVLKNVNFTFEKNKKYVLLGRSGCGKTTLTKAMVGYLGDYQGEILYDNRELHKLTEESVGKLSSMIHQNVYMFDEDIAKNIHLNKSYEQSDFDSALTNSGVALFLDEEKTLETPVGENGSNLSGGQRQRIAVARALTRNKPLMILDEGTSAVDRVTARDIEGRLLAKDDLTLITITHALDADMLSQYDEVLYMEDGEIVEHGPYAKLVEQNGAFSEFLTVSA